MSHSALAAGAALISLAFALSTLERWLDRRLRHELAWTTALFMFSAASFALAAGAALGWTPLTFRVFYLFGAVLNVPFLALGTVYLLAGRRAGDRWSVTVGLLAAFATGVVLVAPLTGPVPPDRLARGSEVFGPLPRVLAAVGSGVGATVIFVGAVVSAWRFRRGRMVWANALIAVGTLVLASSGLLNSVLDEMDGFALTLVIGISVIFAGFLVAVAGPGPPTGSDRPPAPSSAQARRPGAGAVTAGRS